jgi:hypothetical protein
MKDGQIFQLLEEIKTLALSISPELAVSLLESSKLQLYCISHLEERLTRFEQGFPHSGIGLQAPLSISHYNGSAFENEFSDLGDPPDSRNSELFNPGVEPSSQTKENDGQLESLNFTDPMLLEFPGNE